MSNQKSIESLVIYDLKSAIQKFKQGLHRLEALQKGLEILIKKERESNDKTTD